MNKSKKITEMFYITIFNNRTKKSETYHANKLEFGENVFSTTNPNVESEVHIYNGTFGRDDSAIVITTDEPVRVVPERPDGY